MTISLFYESYLITQSTTLRSVDVSAIWSLVAKLLSGTREQDESTSTPTFHDIITVIRSLVRFRRDLVVQTLPHLGYILRQLLMTMRRPRAQLGGKAERYGRTEFPTLDKPPATSRQRRSQGSFSTLRILGHQKHSQSPVIEY